MDKRTLYYIFINMHYTRKGLNLILKMVPCRLYMICYDDALQLLFKPDLLVITISKRLKFEI